MRIALALDDMNDLPVKVADIQNSYTTAPITDNIWTVLGQEFCEDAGRKAIVVRSLYGLNNLGATFRNQLAGCMHSLGFLP